MWYLENKIAFFFFGLFVKYFGNELEKLDLEIYENECELINAKKMKFLLERSLRRKKFYVFSEQKTREMLRQISEVCPIAKEYLDDLRYRRNIVMTHIVAAETLAAVKRFK